jgi:hypothetical protein
MIASTRERHEPGDYVDVRIRRDVRSDYVKTRVYIIRPASLEEFEEYNRQEGLVYGPADGKTYFYYEISMD